MRCNIKLFSGSVYFLAFVLFSASVWGQNLDPDAAAPKYEIPTLKYPTSEVFVATYNIMDYQGADNTGQTDQAPLIQKLLDKCGRRAGDGGVGNGGILFLPEGMYRLNSNIIVPKGVTIRGEWQMPIPGEPIVGTIIVSDYGRGEETSAKSLFILQPTAAVKDLAFWYPQQSPGNIVPYPPTIGYGAPGYWGNEYCVAKNVTFVNSYSGAVLLYGGGAPNMFGLYGTPLKRGVEIDYIAEVGRVEGVDFSPEYWIGSGLPGAPRSDSFKDWLYNNGTAIVMRRNDWSYCSDVNAEGYCVGFYLGPTKTTNEDSKPNGQNYLMRFTGCQTAIYAEGIAGVGAMFHDVQIEDCEYGLYVPPGGDGTLQGSCWEVAATKYAIAIDQDASTHVMVTQSQFLSGEIVTLGGTLSLLDSDVDTEQPQITIGSESRALLGGNRFAEGADIVNNSMYECRIDHNPLGNDYKRIPPCPYPFWRTLNQRPDRDVLYIATQSGVTPDDNIDDTQSLQALLDRAASEGGGVVYLPPGKYRINGHLTIPTGVELHGATDVGSVPTGPGSVLEAYGGKSDADAPPLLTLQEFSGLRGIVIDYPDQMYRELVQAGGGDSTNGILEPYVYPYAVRVAGRGVWIVNVGFRATYSGIDLFTHKCDDVYIEYPSGHLFTNGIRIGGGTDSAVICNAQFNTIGYACGDESKFGGWSNGRPSGWGNQHAYKQNYRDLRFFVLEDCTNTFLFNNFYFGCHVGITFGSENGAPSGLALGHGIDAAVKALYFRDIDDARGGFDLIGSQVVSLRQQGVPESFNEARYLETDALFTGTANLFLADFWGGTGSYATEVNGGTVNMQLVRFDQAGQTRFLESSRGMFRIWGSYVSSPSNRRLANQGATQRFSPAYSVLDTNTPSEVDSTKNLSRSPALLLDNPNILRRIGWTATASHYNNEAMRMLDGRSDDDNYRWGSRAIVQGETYWIVLDMAGLQTFDTILLNQGTSAGDYPQRYDAYVSDDEVNWEIAVVGGRGSDNVTIVRFPETMNARYVKIVMTEPRNYGGTWWSVHEINAALLNGDILDQPEVPEVFAISLDEFPDWEMSDEFPVWEETSDESPAWEEWEEEDMSMPLLSDESVWHEADTQAAPLLVELLELTPEQSDELEKIVWVSIQTFRTQMQEERQGTPGIPPIPSQMRERMERFVDAVQERIAPILKPEQRTKSEAIRFQMTETTDDLNSPTEFWAFDTLYLTSIQQEEIRSIMMDSDVESSGAMEESEQFRDYAESRAEEEFADRMAILLTLTPEQEAPAEEFVTKGWIPRERIRERERDVPVQVQLPPRPSQPRWRERTQETLPVYVPGAGSWQPGQALPAGIIPQVPPPKGRFPRQESY